jgi:aspartyl-tRNA(Asn)/glutamyl-tRNA(Gln) amidotransferase subunit C
MADISIEEVKQVAEVARLAVTDEEAEQFSKELTELLQYVEQLNELDTSDVKPTTHVVDLKNVFRKDEPKEWITQEEALKNAPDSGDGHFRVPAIMED